MSLSSFADDFLQGNDISDPTIGRMLLSDFFTSAENALYSGRQILRDFRELGGQIGTGTFFALRREVLGLDIKATAIQGVPEYLAPRIETFAKATRYQPLQYKYVFEYQTSDPDTGEVSYGLKSFDRSELLTIGDTLQEIEDYLTKDYPHLAETLENLRIVRGYRKS